LPPGFIGKGVEDAKRRRTKAQGEPHLSPRLLSRELKATELLQLVRSHQM